MVMIWGLRRGPSRQVSELERRARILLRQLEEEKAAIILPTVVVSELLVPIAPDKHGEFIAELRRRFICPPFDLQAASLAADLWQRHRQLPRPEQAKRSTLKADTLIVATAKVAGAQVFYSHEAKARRLARLAGLDGRDLPTHHENLFIDHEMRAGDV
jgi:predicted nucleic acid-binding protein